MMAIDREPIVLRFFHYPNYWEMGSIEVQTFDEVVNYLDDLWNRYYQHIEHPVILFLYQDNGDRLGIGLGRVHSTVICVNGSDEWWYSVGDEMAEGTAVFLCPDWTEIAAARLVPYSTALLALREWMEHGRMTDAIKWTDELL
jgi:hypothetical protein